MEILSIKTPIIVPGDDYVQIFLDALVENNVKLRPGDIILAAETAIGTAQNRIVDLEDITEVSEKASLIAGKYKMDERFVQAIMDESQEILGGVDHVLLTLAYGLLLANAGIDQSNAGGPGKICKFPADLWGTVRQFRKDLEERTGISPLGAILADSRVQPLKVGIIGNAISVSGFNPIIDMRGHPDLFGRPLQIKKIAIADELTSAAEVMMGEADEATPFVVIHDAPVQFIPDEEIQEDVMFMPPDLCLFMNVFRNYKKEPILL